ncbi:hypothetical protein [Streptomyces sp. NPDC020141]|uniref:hypothetical protein n=1 Tax=Streptomyces sp. NPDC020141 TaxID=3365065 RepID=UPI0037A122DC
MDRVAEIADLMRRLGPEAARTHMLAEATADPEPAADVETTDDEIMRRYGDRPDHQVEQ